MLPSYLEVNFFPSNEDEERDQSIGEVCSNVRQILEKSILRSLRNLHYKQSTVGPLMSFRCEHCPALHAVNKRHKIYCRPKNKYPRIPLQGRCWFNEDDHKNVNQAVHNLNPQGNLHIESQPQAPPSKCITAKSEEYSRLKKYRPDVEKLIMPELDWIADELNSEEVAFLNDAKCNEAKNPTSMKTPEEKAAMVFALILNRVDADPGALGEFVSILRKKPKTFKPVIIKLDPTGSGAGAVPIRDPVVLPSTSVRRQQIEKDSAVEEDSAPVIPLSAGIRQRRIEDSAQGQRTQDADEMQETDFTPESFQDQRHLWQFMKIGGIMVIGVLAVVMVLQILPLW